MLVQEPSFLTIGDHFVERQWFNLGPAVEGNMAKCQHHSDGNTDLDSDNEVEGDRCRGSEAQNQGVGSRRAQYGADVVNLHHPDRGHHQHAGKCRKRDL